MEAKNILIRELSEDDNDKLQALQELFYVKTNSQAALKAIRGYVKLAEENRLLTGKLQQARQIIDAQKHAINQIRSTIVKVDDYLSVED
jgi:hypothetical protein